jgi:predicted CXXCH cytochrome family protein
MISRSRSIPWIVGLILFSIGVVTYFQLQHNPIVNVTSLEATEEAIALPPLESPFRNTKSNVAYIGDAKCASCHPTIDQTYHRHPMGRSASTATDAPIIENFGLDANHFSALGQFEFGVEKTDRELLHHMSRKNEKGEVLASYTNPVSLVIGSGVRGRSYLCEKDGVVWQSPIGWFTETMAWNLSPGYLSELDFHRPILAKCLFCHTQKVQAVEGSINRFEKPVFQIQNNIGCERCHGPGELHAQERLAGLNPKGIDTSICNPKHLDSNLQASVCQQCHLQGELRLTRRGREMEEYRPGLPFSAFVSVYLRHPNLMDFQRSVGQFEQMQVSKCYLGNPARMTCTSCHDPHSVPNAENKVAFYRGKCNQCHQPDSCSSNKEVRLQKSDDCIACHMPRAESTSIAHAPVTDHRILRNPRKLAKEEIRALPEGEMPIVPFFPLNPTDDQLEADRDLGIALIRSAQNVISIRREIADKILAYAEPKLLATTQKWPNDLANLEALADSYSLRGRKADSFRILKRILQTNPDNESILSKVIDPALLLQENELAIKCAEHLVQLNPHSLSHRLTLARVYQTRNDWVGMLRECREAVKINPLHPFAHAFSAVAFTRNGKKQEADDEIKLALSMLAKPADQQSLQSWYQNSLKN